MLMNGKGATTCLMCDQAGIFAELGRMSIIFGIKLLYSNTDQYNIMLKSAKFCLKCAGRLHQLFDFNLIKCNFDMKRASEKSFDENLCHFCDCSDVMPDEHVPEAKKAIAQTKWAKDYKEDQVVSCCLSCYNFLLLYKSVKEDLDVGREKFYKRIKSWTVDLNEIPESGVHMNMSYLKMYDEIEIKSNESEKRARRGQTPVNSVNNGVEKIRKQPLKAKIIKATARKRGEVLKRTPPDQMHMDKFSLIKLRHSRDRSNKESQWPIKTVIKQEPPEATAVVQESVMCRLPLTDEIVEAINRSMEPVVQSSESQSDISIQDEPTEIESEISIADTPMELDKTIEFPLGLLEAGFNNEPQDKETDEAIETQQNTSVPESEVLTPQNSTEPQLPEPALYPEKEVIPEELLVASDSSDKTELNEPFEVPMSVSGYNTENCMFPDIDFIEEIIETIEEKPQETAVVNHPYDLKEIKVVLKRLDLETLDFYANQRKTVPSPASTPSSSNISRSGRAWKPKIILDPSTSIKERIKKQIKKEKKSLQDSTKKPRPYKKKITSPKDNSTVISSPTSPKIPKVLQFEEEDFSVELIEDIVEYENSNVIGIEVEEVPEIADDHSVVETQVVEFISHRYKNKDPADDVDPNFFLSEAEHVKEMDHLVYEDREDLIASKPIDHSEDTTKESEPSHIRQYLQNGDWLIGIDID